MVAVASPFAIQCSTMCRTWRLASVRGSTIPYCVFLSCLKNETMNLSRSCIVLSDTPLGLALCLWLCFLRMAPSTRR